MREDLLDHENSRKNPERHGETSEDRGHLGAGADDTEAGVEAHDEMGGHTTSGEVEDNGNGLADERGNRVRCYGEGNHTRVSFLKSALTPTFFFSSPSSCSRSGKGDQDRERTGKVIN